MRAGSKPWTTLWVRVGVVGGAGGWRAVGAPRPRRPPNPAPRRSTTPFPPSAASGDAYGLARFHASRTALARRVLTGGAPPLLLSLAYSVAGALLGSPAGAEFLAARDAAAAVGADVVLGDRDVRTSLQRVAAAAMAEARHIAICPHNPSGPVANAATLQLAACTPNFFIHETMAVDVPWRREIANEQMRFSQGRMTIPDAPGLGIDLNEEAIAAHPYEPRDLRHYSGNLTDIRPDNATGYFKE